MNSSIGLDPQRVREGVVDTATAHVHHLFDHATGVTMVAIAGWPTLEHR
ncbi:hypothetical protein ACIQFP_14625 [Nocardiopsis alba]